MLELKSKYENHRSEKITFEKDVDKDLLVTVDSEYESQEIYISEEDALKLIDWLEEKYK